MSETEGVREWAKTLNLSSDTVDVLEKKGFDTTDKLRRLKIDEMTESIQKPKLLSSIECLKLKDALVSLSGEKVGTGAAICPDKPVASDTGHASRNVNPSEELREWAERQKLPSAIVDVLEEEGFDMESLRQLTVDDFKDFENIIQKPKLLKAAQCLKLRKVLETLCDAPGYDGGSEQTSARAKVTPPPVVSPKVRDTTASQPAGQRSMEPTPSEEPWQTIKPQPGQVSRTRRVFEGIKEGVKFVFGSEPEEEEYFRFLLLGKTGSGKSATGNTIFGENLFPSGLNFSSQTATCDLQISKKRGRTIDIMDSPGLYDTSKTQETIGTIIVQAVACTHPGPHAILYVVRIGRYTEEEYGVYNRLKALFDDDIKNYIIIVFTGGDELEESGQDLAKILRTGPKHLLEVVEDCDHRTIVFNNKAKDKQPQVERLLTMVREIKAAKANKPYMCPKYAYVGEGLEKEVERRMEAVRTRDLEREQYVKELEEKKRKAEEEIRRQKEQFERKEREREEEIRHEKERRERETKELREKLERKEQELMIQREKELAMEEEERNKEEMKARELEQQQEEIHRSIRRRVQEQTELMRRLNEDRQREKEEIKRKEREREEYERKRREEEIQEAERRQRAYEEEMRKAKQEIAEPGWVEWAVNGVKSWFW